MLDAATVAVQGILALLPEGVSVSFLPLTQLAGQVASGLGVLFDVTAVSTVVATILTIEGFTLGVRIVIWSYKRLPFVGG
jgi:hypothetical protein